MIESDQVAGGTHKATSEQVAIGEMREHLDDDLGGEEMEHDGRRRGASIIGPRDPMSLAQQCLSFLPSFTSTGSFNVVPVYKGTDFSPPPAAAHFPCHLVLPGGHREAS